MTELCCSQPLVRVGPQKKRPGAHQPHKNHRATRNTGKRGKGKYVRVLRRDVKLAFSRSLTLRTPRGEESD